MKETKKFPAKTFGIAVSSIVAAVLIVMTVFAFKARYTGFSAEKTAVQFAQSIVQNGDGYNAYKNTMLCVNKKLKYGDFIYNAYMAPLVNEEANQAAFVGTGSDVEQQKIDDVYSTMYEYYLELLRTVGWDNYDEFFTYYFAKLKETRTEIYGDEYLDRDYMFGALEANVEQYSKSLTGSNAVLAADGKTVLQEATKGRYQELFGVNYEIKVAASESKELTDFEKQEYIAALKERLAIATAPAEEAVDSNDEIVRKIKEAFAGLECADDADKVEEITLTVVVNGEEKTAQTLYAVHIDGCWYVDNTNADTRSLYIAGL